MSDAITTARYLVIDCKYTNIQANNIRKALQRKNINASYIGKLHPEEVELSREVYVTAMNDLLYRLKTRRPIAIVYMFWGATEGTLKECWEIIDSLSGFQSHAKLRPKEITGVEKVENVLIISFDEKWKDH